MKVWKATVSALALLLHHGSVTGQYTVYDKSNILDNMNTIVHLFEWPWTAVQSECEWLSQNGYGAVQVSPPQEHVVEKKGEGSWNIPWWVSYQPVSYELNSMRGTEQEFKNMVDACNAVGVRIIVDAVINHMTGSPGSNTDDDKSSSGNCAWDTHYDTRDFPCVPYSNLDFNSYCTDGCNCDDDSCCSCCPNSIGDHNDAYNSRPNAVRKCMLSGLVDLNHSKEYVRNKIADYLNKLVAMGVAGFRVDASKHMYPGDLQAIVDLTNDLDPKIFGANQRPFFTHEIIDRSGTEAVKYLEYLSAGRTMNFRYGYRLSAALSFGGHIFDFQPRPGFDGYGYDNEHEMVVFVDNHDNQREHHVEDRPLTHTNPQQYKMAVAFMLAWPYGLPRVMSSFPFNERDDGPPWTQSTTNGLPYMRPTPTNVTHVMEHRWPEIQCMAVFRADVAGTAIANIVPGPFGDQIAFARVGRGYFGVNNAGDSHTFTNVRTTLPAGTYCDVFGGLVSGGGPCSIVVDSNGLATFTIGANSAVAFHIKSAVTSIPAPSPPNPNWQTTAVLIKKPLGLGKNLFLRGGNQNDNGIPIHHKTEVPFFFNEYDSWRQGDNYLDWGGTGAAELDQGTFYGTAASGTPMAWSTNDNTKPEYQALNKYGEDYWMVVVKMDCSQTENGWFRLKGFIAPDNTWENSISQGVCGGDAGLSYNSASDNHFAYCGKVNVFEWGTGSCTIDNFPSDWKTTVIFLEKETTTDEYVFVRGSDLDGNAIPIEHKTATSFQEYLAWAFQDTQLGPGAEEPNQGTLQHLPAGGTPLVWSTNDNTNVGYQALNHYGPHYWMVELNMDCSQTTDGWFKFHGFLGGPSTYEEADHEQYMCAQSQQIDQFFQSTYFGPGSTLGQNVAKCGQVNVFKWGTGQCIRESLPQGYLSPGPILTRTVILMKMVTTSGQYVFIRGGTSSDQEIPIVHQTVVPYNFGEYLAWSQGDNHFSWGGAESGQASVAYNGVAASGTPLAWSTNDANADAHNKYNTYGDHYWVVELDMDCSVLASSNGWFSLKAFVATSPGWESDRNQGACSGTAGGTSPYTSGNHMARCGFVNVFEQGQDACTINNI